MENKEQLYDKTSDDWGVIEKRLIELEAENQALLQLLLLDEFHEWIELYDWEFNPVCFNGVIKYRWVNENYSGQETTKGLYDIFLTQKITITG